MIVDSWPPGRPGVLNVLVWRGPLAKVSRDSLFLLTCAWLAARSAGSYSKLSVQDEDENILDDDSADDNDDGVLYGV